ncbi:MAG: hypothetical protein HY208_08530, partial [Nitrospirae bacterium]|nr:hypothetical protein [Nitrospirota bacterium]
MVNDRRHQRLAARGAILSLVFSLCWLAGSVFSPAYGYEERPVRDGGALTGRVILNGPVPEPRV